MDTVDLAAKIRRHALRMANRGGSGHLASSLSMADLLAVLYGQIMSINPEEPLWQDRDRFILSKGHAGASVYAVLAECGFFPVEKLDTHCQNGSDLSGHVSHRGVPGIEISSGSLGHGLPIGAGMAYGAKLDQGSYRIFVLMSDGECDEGSNWEAILFAAHHSLDNLVAIIDYNKIQALGRVEDTIRLEPFAEKWRSFGWQVREIDGHNHSEIMAVFKSLPLKKGFPSCVIAHTTKGKGVSFMENTVEWHYRTPRGEEYENALHELGGSA
jgi:transketolase